MFKPLSANPTKWSNTLKQFVGKSRLLVYIVKVFQYYFWYQSQYNKKLVFKKPFTTFFLLLKNDIRDFESFLKNCVQLQRTIEKLVSRLRGPPSPSLFQSFVPEFHFQCLTCMNNNYSIYSQCTLSLPLKISENRKVF